MCPDREILSAYLDGEVALKWAKQIESHLLECPDCAAYLEQLKRTSNLLRGDALSIDADSSRSRSWEVLENELEDLEPSFFRRKFQLPAPLAAAAAVFLTFFAGAFIYNLNPGKTPVIVQTPVVQEAPAAATISVEDMQRILTLWEAAYSSEGTIVHFELPEDSVFQLESEPRILQTVDYTREAP